MTTTITQPFLDVSMSEEDWAGYTVTSTFSDKPATVYGIVVSNSSTTLVIDLWYRHRAFWFYYTFLPRISRTITWALVARMARMAIQKGSR